MAQSYEMFLKLRFAPSSATYVPLSKKVEGILKRTYKKRVLVAYILHAGYRSVSKDTKMLVYYSDDHGAITKHEGYCCSTPETSWETLAKEVADSWPEYKVKHRNKPISETKHITNNAYI